MRIEYLHQNYFSFAMLCLKKINQLCGSTHSELQKNFELWLASQEVGSIECEIAQVALSSITFEKVCPALISEKRCQYFLSPSAKIKQPSELYEDLQAFRRVTGVASSWNEECVIAEVNRKRMNRVVASAWKLEIYANQHFATLLRLARCFKLMTWISQTLEGTKIVIGGSLRAHSKNYLYARELCAVAHRALSYSGVKILCFPTLDSKNAYTFLSSDPIHHLKREIKTFDSALEKQIERWLSKKQGVAWTINRESKILESKEGVFVPDFSIKKLHSGVEILVEVIGFWSHRYLERKLRFLDLFFDQKIVYIINADTLEKNVLAAQFFKHPRVFGYGKKLNAEAFFAWLQDIKF